MAHIRMDDKLFGTATTCVFCIGVGRMVHDQQQRAERHRVAKQIASRMRTANVYEFVALTAHA